MKTVSLVAAVLLMSSAPIATAADSGRLMYLREYDAVAIRMLSCADMLTHSASRFRDIGSKRVKIMSKAFRAAGRAAVVRAALEAPGVTPAPKVPNLRYESKDAIAFVTNDLRVHEARAAEFAADLRASEFDITSSCISDKVVDEAKSLNQWFAKDTSVLTAVK
jgi:hypothetical protein